MHDTYDELTDRLAWIRLRALIDRIEDCTMFRRLVRALETLSSIERRLLCRLVACRRLPPCLSVCLSVCPSFFTSSTLRVAPPYDDRIDRRRRLC